MSAAVCVESERGAEECCCECTRCSASGAGMEEVAILMHWAAAAATLMRRARGGRQGGLSRRGGGPGAQGALGLFVVVAVVVQERKGHCSGRRGGGGRCARSCAQNRSVGCRALAAAAHAQPGVDTRGRILSRDRQDKAPARGATSGAGRCAARGGRTRGRAVAPSRTGQQQTGAASNHGSKSWARSRAHAAGQGRRLRVLPTPAGMRPAKRLARRAPLLRGHTWWRGAEHRYGLARAQTLSAG